MRQDGKTEQLVRNGGAAVLWLLGWCAILVALGDGRSALMVVGGALVGLALLNAVPIVIEAALREAATPVRLAGAAVVAMAILAWVVALCAGLPAYVLTRAGWWA